MENLALCVSTYINSNNIAHSPTAVGYRAQAILYQARGYEFAAIIPPLENDEYAYTVFRQQLRPADQQQPQPLYQFIPNPSQGTSTLSYQMGKKETGTLTLFDLTGRLLVNTPLHGTGSYVLDTYNYPAGVYTYTVSTNGKVIERHKLVIVH